MKSWKRITLVTFVLIGGFASFGYWAITQFDIAFDSFDSLSSSHLADTRSAYSSFKQNIVKEVASSTDAGIDTDVDSGLSFTFPKSGDEVYVGCTYKISWQSLTDINSLETALIDYGTREPVGPIASGLAKENIFKADPQNLLWKVGVVWPGSYYIKVSKINGAEAEFRSEIFKINKIPEGLDGEDGVNICKESR